MILFDFSIKTENEKKLNNNKGKEQLKEQLKLYFLKKSNSFNHLANKLNHRENKTLRFFIVEKFMGENRTVQRLRELKGRGTQSSRT